MKKNIPDVSQDFLEGLILKSLTCPAMLVSSDSFIVSLNTEAECLFGIKSGHSKRIDEIFTDFDVENDLSSLLQFLDCRGGKYIQWCPVPCNSLESPFFVLMGIDITAHVKTKHEEKDKRVHLEKILDRLPHFIFWKDSNSSFLGCNKKFAESAGLSSPAEIVGKKDEDLPWRENAKDYVADDRDVIENKKEKLNIEEPQRTQDGREIVLNTNKVPFYDDEGIVAGLVGIYTDITEKKQAERDLKKAKREAEAAKLAQTALLENASHDIRTPLSSIIGCADLLRTRITNNEDLEFLEDIQISGEALMNYMDLTLEYIRNISSDTHVSTKKFDLLELIQSVIDVNKSSMTLKDLDITVDYDQSIPHYLLGDTKRVQNILLNLLGNAIKFTSTGEIIVTAKLKKQDKEKRELILQLSVSDSGIGIAEDQQEVIFTKFKRLNSAHAGIYKGQGLGLSLVKQYVDELDGEIYVKSALGEGSTFTCIIPFKQPLLDEDELGVSHFGSARLPDAKESVVSSKVEKPLREKEKASYSKPRVLLVEDQPMLIRLSTECLERLGCYVEHTSSGKEALERLCRYDYDVVFMDIGLPDVQGDDVTRQFRKMYPEKSTLIVALTAHRLQRFQDAYLEAGMDGVFFKPLTAEKVQPLLDDFKERKADFFKKPL